IASPPEKQTHADTPGTPLGPFAAYAKIIRGTFPPPRFEVWGKTPHPAPPPPAMTRCDAQWVGRAGVNLRHIPERRFHQILAIISFSSFEHGHSGPLALEGVWLLMCRSASENATSNVSLLSC